MTRHPAPRSLLPLTVIALTAVVPHAASLAQTTISSPTTTTQTVPSGGTLTVTSAGSITISGSNTAVTMSGGTAGSPTTLNNSGSISQTGTGRAVRANATGSVLMIQNLAGASISSVGNDTIAVGSSTVSSSSVSFTNAGTITSGNASTTSGNQAINFGNLTSGTNSVTNSGTITAFVADAVRPGTNGTVNNTGTIMSTAANGSGSDGIDAQANSGVQITNSSSGATTNSLIEGGRHGITGGNTTGTGAFTMSITNNPLGTIRGDNGAGVNIDGLNANEVVTVLNRGTITGNGVTGDGDGVDVDGLANVTNTGTIRSINAFSATGSGVALSEGLSVGGGTITNSGTIEGLVAAGNTNAVGRGISLVGNDITTGPLMGTREAIYGNATVTNQSGGLIRGDSDSGIFVGGPASGFTVTINNEAGATIRGGGATSAAIQTGADNDTINNAGTIRADTNNLAIDMGGGNNTLNITGGVASIVGNVSGGTGGTNALAITPGTGNAFSYAGAFSNFATVQVNAGTTTLSGDSTYTGTTTVANGGTLVAANVAANNGSATGTGAVTVQNGGTLAGTGRIAGTVTLASSALLSPSNRGAMTPGRLTLGGDLNVTGGSRFAFTLGSTPAGSDTLSVSGMLNFTTGPGPLVFDVLNGGDLTTGRYELINFGSYNGLTTADLSFGTTPAGFSGTFDLNGNSLGLTVNVVPEPATVSVLLVGSLALGVGTWLKRKHRLTPAGGHRASGDV